MSNHCLADRLYGRVQKTDGCWLWQGKPDKTGYGRLRAGGKTLYVTRVAWELANGPVPQGQYLHHTCANRLCVRPDHMSLERLQPAVPKGTKRQRRRDPGDIWEHVDKGPECWIWRRSPVTVRYLDNLTERRTTVQQLAWISTYGSVPEGLCVIRACPSPGCVRPDHLMLGSKTAVSKVRNIYGHTARGESHGRARLSAADVYEIRRLADSGHDVAEITRRFGISRSHALEIIMRRAWQHLPEKSRDTASPPWIDHQVTPPVPIRPPAESIPLHR